MKNKIISSLVITLVVGILSCQTKKNNPTDSNAEIINLKSTNQKSPIKLSRLIRHEKYIPLETNENCMIGFIKKIDVYKNRIFILDPYFAKKMLVFDTKGKFLDNIGTKGNGPGEYGDIFDFVIQNDKVYILDDRTSVLEYQTDGTYLKTYQLPLWTDKFLKINNKKWGLITNSDKSDKSASNFHITDNDFTNKKGFIKSKYDDFPVLPFQQTCSLNDTNFFFLPFDHRIYEVTDQGIKIKYSVQFPDDCILNDSKRADYIKLPLKDRVQKILNTTVFISGIIFTDPLKIISFSQKRQKLLCFIQRNNQNVIIPQKELVNDVDNVPILPTFCSGFDSDKIVAYFQAFELTEAVKNNKDKNTELKKYLSDEETEANPVIAIYSIAEDEK
jgi:hypothetical protein